MFDHGFCGLVPSFYYCVATLPVKIARNASVEVESREVTGEEERRRGREAFLKDPYAAKMSAFLGGGNMHVLEKDGEALGYYNVNPGVFEKARKAKMGKPFGYVNSITVKNRQAAIAVLRRGAELAKEAGENEIRILESHETLITQTILSLGGTYLLRPSCPLTGLDAEMAAILDFEGLTHKLRDEFQGRLEKVGTLLGTRLSLELEGTVVGFVWESGAFEIVSEKQKVHRVLPRWVVTRLYMGYYSGADVLAIGHIPCDRSDGRNPDDPKRDMQPLSLPEKEATLFRALFPKLWPCSLPDPDVWPWVIGEPHPEYQHESA